MQVVVGVDPDVAQGLRGVMPGEREAAIRAATDAASVTLVPQHPDAEDPLLARWFTAAVPDPEAARRLASRLLELEGVDAAFVKPAARPEAG